MEAAPIPVEIVDPTSSHPETLSISYGYDPQRFDGAIKCPIFMTSTFEFASAADGAQHFQEALHPSSHHPEHHHPNPHHVDKASYIYSRLDNPNNHLFEQRIAQWDSNEKALLFSSGMAAISTTLLAFLHSGQQVVASGPMYGGTYGLLSSVLTRFQIESKIIHITNNFINELVALDHSKTRILFVECPANPSNLLVDIKAVCDLRDKWNVDRKSADKILVIVDNTFLGPKYQNPKELGADLTLYSATKFLGGHSDVIAGCVSGSEDHINVIAGMRTELGTTCSPFDAFLLLRSLETLSVRMHKQQKNAIRLAEALNDFKKQHPKVLSAIYYPGLLEQQQSEEKDEEGAYQLQIYKKQCKGPGSLISFELHGGQEAAYKVLDSLKVIHLAVSLGGTESLAQHPYSMTHALMDPETKKLHGVTAGLIRLSVGIENVEDLKRDLLGALQRLVV